MNTWAKLGFDVGACAFGIFVGGSLTLAIMSDPPPPPVECPDVQKTFEIMIYVLVNVEEAVERFCVGDYALGEIEECREMLDEEVESNMRLHEDFDAYDAMSFQTCDDFINHECGCHGDDVQ